MMLGVGWGGGIKKEKDDNFKIRAKTRQLGGWGGGGGYTQKHCSAMMITTKNMVQIHDEQRSIQMTIVHRDTHKATLFSQAL